MLICNVFLLVGIDYILLNKWVIVIYCDWGVCYIWLCFVCVLFKEFFVVVCVELVKCGWVLLL